MKIDLKDGGWILGGVELTETMCSCPTCTCQPYWQIRYAIFNAEGQARIRGSRGLTACTSEQAALEEMENDIIRLSIRFDKIAG